MLLGERDRKPGEYLWLRSAACKRSTRIESVHPITHKVCRRRRRARAPGVPASARSASQKNGKSDVKKVKKPAGSPKIEHIVPTKRM